MPKYSLVGIDGNAFFILGYVKRAMRQEGFCDFDIEMYHEDATSGDYDNLLRVSEERIDACNFHANIKDGSAFSKSLQEEKVKKEEAAELREKIMEELVFGENPKYSLVGIDGNAFSILGYVRKAMKREGFSRENVEEYTKDAQSDDYDHLVSVSIDYLNKCNEKVRQNECFDYGEEL